MAVPPQPPAGHAQRSAGLTLQVGQGLSVLRTRSERPVAAPASTSSAMCPNFFSRHGLQKLWPAGHKSGNKLRS